MKKRMIWKRVITAVLILSMCGTFFLNDSMQAVAGSLSEAQSEKKELEKALKEAQGLIDDLKNSQGDVQDTIDSLNTQLVSISAKITSLENDLTDKSNAIVDTQEELSAAQADAAQQYEDMKVRIQFMYENSRSSYLELLLSSRNVSEFLNAAEYISEIESYDRLKLKEYQDTIAFISDTEETLKQEYADLEDMKAEVEEQKQAVAALMDKKETQLASIEDDISDAQTDADYYEAEIQAQDEMIAEIQAAEAAKKAAEAKKAQEEAEKAQAAQDAANAGTGSTETGSTDTGSGDTGSTDTATPPANEYNGGAFKWPCPSSTRVTSDYGNRVSPTAGASSYHKGIDIGAGYGADIVAAADGRVVTAAYSSSGGNYVMIDHGNGLYTVYMHASSLCVSAGQNVTAGQVVAKVGSTGISTGNHLHFGVSLNGSYVSPWNYLSR